MNTCIDVLEFLSITTRILCFKNNLLWQSALDLPSPGSMQKHTNPIMKRRLNIYLTQLDYNIIIYLTVCK